MRERAPPRNERAGEFGQKEAETRRIRLSRETGRKERGQPFIAGRLFSARSILGAPPRANSCVSISLGCTRKQYTECLVQNSGFKPEGFVLLKVRGEADKTPGDGPSSMRNIVLASGCIRRGPILRAGPVIECRISIEMPSIVQLRLARMQSAGVLVPIAYFLVGAALYGSTLNIFFMSDDFEFLKIVASAQSVFVVFEPLVGRFVRPLVVLMYYVNYHSFGLSPWTYHLSTLLPHLLSAWLVYLVARRLDDSGDDLWAFLAGLLFLVFAGHSEAVTWPAGIADPILTVCLLIAFLCYLRALDPRSSSLWLAAVFAAVVAATQAKELWVVFPGLIVAHTVSFGVLGDLRGRRRALIVVAGTSVLVAAYLMVRHRVFGSVAGGYAGLDSSLRAGIFGEQVRAFLFRSFFPASPHLAGKLMRRLDVILLVATLLVMARSARGRAARVLIFSGLALVIALLPVLPLTVSISTTEGERYVYLPTAFSCILVITVIRTVLTRRIVTVLACMVVIGVNAAALVRANAQWGVSGTLTRSIIDSYADEVLKHDPLSTAATFILNLPDNVGGAYVFRNGFYPAVQLVRPEVAARTGRTLIVATQSLLGHADETRVTNAGDGRFRLEIGNNRLLQPQIPSSVHYRIESQTPGSYQVKFGPSLKAGLVLYLTRGHLEVAGTIDGPGLPFGQIDVPAEDARCEGDSIRFMGWALDDEGISRVVLKDVGSHPGATTGGPAMLGEADPGARPDVALIFPGYPGAKRAGWTLQLSCARVETNPGGLMRVGVIAYDRGGRQAVIGERSVRAAK